MLYHKARRHLSPIRLTIKALTEPEVEVQVVEPWAKALKVKLLPSIPYIVSIHERVEIELHRSSLDLNVAVHRVLLLIMETQVEKDTITTKGSQLGNVNRWKRFWRIPVASWVSFEIAFYGHLRLC
jgi:hypothetical protein